MLNFEIEVEDVDPKITLLKYIRDDLQLTGSKLSCGQGGCGACTVMLSTVDRKTSQLQHYTVNACVYPLVCVHGKAVTTVEGIGSTRTVLHPVQERLAKCHGTQCGFCSPGMVMSMYTLLRNTSKPTVEQIEQAIQGNLCRCTGYRPILDSFKTFVDEGCPLGENCCKNDKSYVPQRLLYDVESFKSLNETQEIIFPSELQMNKAYDKESLLFKKKDTFWFRPVTLEEATAVKKSSQDSEWAMGHVTKRVSLRSKKKMIISVGHLQELIGIQFTDKFMEIGAGTTLSELQNTLSNYQSMIDAKGNCKMIADCLLSTFSNWISGEQIKNVATLGGNIMEGESTSNFLPMLMILQAEAVFTDGSSEFIFQINNDFVNGTKDRNSDYLLTKIRIPLMDGDLIGYYYAKQQTHITGRSSVVSVVFRARLNSDKEVSRLSCAFGGILKHPVMYDNVIKNRQWNEDIIRTYKSWCQHTIIGTADGKQYETSVASDFFTKFFDDVEHLLQKSIMHGLVSKYHKPNSCIKDIHVWEPQSNRKSVGKPIPTQWALEHVTGEAKYIMDMPKFQDELYMVLVTSRKAHANILSLEVTNALSIPGVVDYICHKDIPGKNVLVTGNAEDEEIFATKEVTHFTQTIGGIVATTAEAAAEGAAAVMIQYEELPTIYTMKDAIEKGSFLFPQKAVEHGDITEGFKRSTNILEGEVEFEGQEHYYMETHCAIAVPKQEYSQLDIYSSTQGQCGVQDGINRALNIPWHKINVHTKRLGGGFGGKLFRCNLTAVPAAIAAYKHNKPVRLSLNRALDMSTSGGRHPCYVKYKIGFNKDGKLEAFECHIYLDGGDTMDATDLVVSKMMSRVDNCFNIPNAKITGNGCKTNLASNTGYRGFGTPKAVHIVNICAERIAKYLNISILQVYDVNLYRDEDLTFSNQVLENCTIRKCWDVLMKTSDYVERKANIAEFNKQNKKKKKGIAMTTVKYDTTFSGATALNQGAALVNIYTDGSVLVHHGGIELGQGLNIKMIQIASETLGVHHSKIIIDETSTNTVPNTVITASSSATDLFGGAVKNACDKLKARLQSLRDRKPKATWEEIVSSSFFERVPLSATGYYKPAGVWYDPQKNEGDPAIYYTFGAACSEIELDVLTGEHKLVQTDIVFDIGKSLNPAIDIGQIEGAFLHGYGFYCMEELIYSPNGELLTNGPSTYRIPTVNDIPPTFNITLLKEEPHEKAVYSSKGIGEPPLLLATSACMAIKDAVTSVRIDNGLSEDFQLNCPTTPKRVLHTCRN